MWTCPNCDAKLVARNLSHSCVRRTVDEFFASKPAGGVKLARALIRAAKRFGPLTLHPVKTRVALMPGGQGVRFAAIYRVSDDSIRGHVWLREQRSSKRFAKIEKLGARDWLYHFVVSDEQPLDAELVAFLRRGYAGAKRPKRP